MGLLLIDKAGSQITLANVMDINETHPTKLQVIKTTGVDSDIVQLFGASNRSLTFKGITQTLDEKVFLQNAMNDTGSIAFSSEIGLIDYRTGTVTIEADFDSNDFDPNDFNCGQTFPGYAGINVFFYGLTFKDLGNRPMERAYQFNVIEVK